MSVTEILLLILGAVIFAAGFLIPEKKTGTGEMPDTEELKKEFAKSADQLVDDARHRIGEIVTMECGIAQDDTQREMERITNDKLMAINEYGKTVLEEIERNHKEVMFLYDMLNDKSADIKNTVRKVESVKLAAAAAESGSKTPEPEKEEKKPEKKKASGNSGVKKNPEKSIKVPKMFAPGEITETKTGKDTEDKEKSGKENTGGSQVRIHKKILEMHDAGRSDKEIARELGIGVGEVRLKIGLAEAGRTKDEA